MQAKYYDLSDAIEFSCQRTSILQLIENGDIRPLRLDSLTIEEPVFIKNNTVQVQSSNNNNDNNNNKLCRMCGEKGETISHLVSECGKLAQREYKRRHDYVARYVHWQLCNKGGLERDEKWYEQQPE